MPIYYPPDSRPNCCSSCEYDASNVPCGTCGVSGVTYTPNGAGLGTTYRPRCGECAASEWYQCIGCDDYFLYDRTCDSDSDWCTSCCDCCCSPDGGTPFTPSSINSYMYKPSPVFHGEGRVFLGLELEIETYSTSACADVATARLGALGYLKEDGSLSCGFEIVTHPMTHQYAADSFPWEMLKELSDCGADAGDSAGVHVHVNRSAFDGPAHVFRWMKLVYRNQGPVQGLARRRSSQWARFSDTARRGVKGYAKGERYADRYEAVNVTNANTFEVRVFASTLDTQELRAALDFVAASVEYTRQLTVPVIAQGGWNWAAFMEWCDAQGGVYDALIEEAGEYV